MELQELEKKYTELGEKYAELGKEIEALKVEKEFNYPIYCLSKKTKKIVKFDELKSGIVVKQDYKHDVDFNSTFWIDHTDTDSWEQLKVCPETGFYDGQLVWCWDNEDTHYRALKFYDAINQNTFEYNGKEGVSTYDNYEAFEGNWPEWAVDAFETLERH